jgi:hypothetical protein
MKGEELMVGWFEFVLKGRSFNLCGKLTHARSTVEEWRFSCPVP